jgi:hypothetical protein
VTPQYELRMMVESTSVWRLEIWQAPSPATPRLKAPEHVATIQGPGLRIAENRLLKRLAREKIVLGSLKPGKTKRWPLDEEMALTLGLLFRVLAPMKTWIASARSQREWRRCRARKQDTGSVW